MSLYLMACGASYRGWGCGVSDSVDCFPAMDSSIGECRGRAGVALVGWSLAAPG